MTLAQNANPGGWRKLNRLAEEAMPLADALLPDPAGLVALEAVAAEHPDEGVRLQAEVVLDPGGIPDEPEYVEEMFAHPKIALGGLGINVEASLLFREGSGQQAQDLADWAYPYDDIIEWSWLGGTPSGPLPAWPHRDDGTPLAHIAQLDLKVLRTERYAWARRQGMPGRGVLQVFHDLETAGTEPDDGRRGAWLVRYVEHPEPPVEAPTSLEPAARRPPAFIETASDVSLPPPFEVDLDAVQADRYLALTEQWSRERNNGIDGPDDWRSLLPITHWLGYPSNGREPAEHVLQETLPLESGDRWELLLEACNDGLLEGWFGDAGSLEIWIRRSDLERQDFNHVWALIASG